MDIFVTNKNGFTHTDKYNGIEFVFPPDEKQVVPEEAARLFFNFGMPDKTEALVRAGWANRGDEGVKTLSNFVFTQAMMVEVPAE